MSTDNTTGVQTRAMTEAQQMEAEANGEVTNNLEQAQGIPNPAMNPTVDLHGAKENLSKNLSGNKAQLHWTGMYRTLTTLE